MKVSTAIRNALLDNDDLKAKLDGFVIRVYDGTVPATADAALSGNTLLLEYQSDNGGGGTLTFDATASNGVLNKNSAEVWSNDAAANGTPTFARLVKPSDDGTLSTTALRLQLTAGVGDVELQMSSATLVAGTPQRLNSFYVAMGGGS